MSTRRDLPTFVLRPGALSFVRAAGGRAETRPLPAGAYALGSGEDPGRPEGLDRAALRAAIQACMAAAGRVRKARLVLEGPLVRVLTLPFAHQPAPDELHLAVQTEAERYVIFAGSAIVLDVQVLQHAGDALDVLFAAMRRDQADALLEAFAAEGVRIQGIDPLSLALAQRLAGAPDAAELAGVALLLWHRLTVSTWRAGLPVGWRSVFVDGEALARGDAAALADARAELRRTLGEMPARRWLLAGLPATLDDAFRLDADAVLGRPAGLPTDLAELDLAGRAPIVSLLPEAPQGRPLWTAWQLAGGVAFAAILIGLLGTNVLLERRVATARTELERLQAQTDVLRIEVARQQAESKDNPAPVFALRHGAATTLAALREALPADTWLEEAMIEPAREVRLDGSSLSRSSPLRYAQALSRRRELSEVALIAVRQDERGGREVFHFLIKARIRAGAREAQP